MRQPLYLEVNFPPIEHVLTALAFEEVHEVWSLRVQTAANLGRVVSINVFEEAPYFLGRRTTVVLPV